VNIGLKIVEIGIERHSSIVVINFAIRDLSMPNAKIEHARVSAAVAWRRSRKIGLTIAIHLNANHWMQDQEFAQ
jgi:hypothetical protein